MENCKFPKQPGWWDLESSETIKNLSKLQKEFRLSSEDQIRINYLEARKQWSTLKEKKKTRFNQRVLAKLVKASNSTLFWKIINSERKKNPQIKANLITEEMW